MAVVFTESIFHGTDALFFQLLQLTRRLTTQTITTHQTQKITNSNGAANRITDAVPNAF